MSRRRFGRSTTGPSTPWRCRWRTSGTARRLTGTDLERTTITRAEPALPVWVTRRAAASDALPDGPLEVRVLPPRSGGGNAGRRPVRPGRRVRGPSADVLHRTRALPRHLRRRHVLLRPPH